MRVSFPPGVTSQIAADASIIAKNYASDRQWRSAQTISPISGVGFSGLKVSKVFLMYQELGTKPYLMTSLEGRTVPIKGDSGTHFVKVRGVGKPGYVTLPGGVKVWRNQKWRHPGIQPTYFLGSSVRASIQQNRPLIESMMRTLLGFSDGTPIQ